MVFGAGSEWFFQFIPGGKKIGSVWFRFQFLVWFQLDTLIKDRLTPQIALIGEKVASELALLHLFLNVSV